TRWYRIVRDRHDVRSDTGARQGAEGARAHRIHARSAARGRAADGELRNTEAEHARQSRGYASAGPHQFAVVGRGEGALRVRHGHPGLVQRLVLQIVVADGWETGEGSARRRIRKGLETQSMAELVQQHGEQID